MMATTVPNSPTSGSNAPASLSGGVQNKLQASRFEFKYVIQPKQVRPIYEFVRCYLEPDQFTADGLTLGYPVHSLYLDSVDLHTCQATMHGEKNRFKLRIRFYDDDPNHPVFFEIKRRQNSVILKQRAMVQRRFADDLVNGASPDPAYLARHDAKNWQALFEFCYLRDKLVARPAAYTSYMRAGYEPQHGNSIRVTFDQMIRAGKFNGHLSATDFRSWPMIDVPGIVLELKFTDRFPNWMQDLTDTFDLARGSMAKYVECVTLLKAVEH